MSDKTLTELLIVPVLKSLFTGLLVALFVITGYSLIDAVTLWRIFWFTSTAVSLAVWSYYLIGEGKGRTEQVHYYYDINTPAPAPIETTPIQVISSERGYNYPRGKYSNLPVTPQELEAVAVQYIATGKKFSYRTMSGRGKPLTRTRYENLVNKMLEDELAEEVYPGVENSPITLTQEGDTLLEGIAGARDTHAHTRAHYQKG